MRGEHVVSVNENRGNVDHLALRLVDNRQQHHVHTVTHRVTHAAQSSSWEGSRGSIGHLHEAAISLQAGSIGSTVSSTTTSS